MKFFQFISLILDLYFYIILTQDGITFLERPLWLHFRTCKFIFWIARDQAGQTNFFSPSKLNYHQIKAIINIPRYFSTPILGFTCETLGCNWLCNIWLGRGVTKMLKWWTVTKMGLSSKWHKLLWQNVIQNCATTKKIK